ncbi:MAG: DMT family transporter [Bacteroidota bacterium]
MQYLLILLALLAGVVLPVQAAVNAKLGTSAKSAELGALLSFVIGIAGLFVYCFLARIDLSAWKNTLSLPWYYWLGGLLGAFYVVSLIILAPKLGVGLTLGLSVAGQMIFGLVMDHYGWLGLEERSIKWPQILGAALIIAGVLLLRLKSFPWEGSS